MCEIIHSPHLLRTHIRCQWINLIQETVDVHCVYAFDGEKWICIQDGIFYTFLQKWINLHFKRNQHLFGAFHYNSGIEFQARNNDCCVNRWQMPLPTFIIAKAYQISLKCIVLSFNDKIKMNKHELSFLAWYAFWSGT